MWRPGMGAETSGISAAAALRPARYGLQPGCRADLVVIAASGVPEAIASHPERLLVAQRACRERGNGQWSRPLGMNVSGRRLGLAAG